MRRTCRIAAAALIAACTPALALPAQTTNPFTAPPKLATARALVLPTIVERTLPNGLKLVIVEQHELPIVDIALVVRNGTEAEPARKNGLATLTAGLLTEGAGPRDAAAIAEQQAYLAIQLGAGSGFEQSTIRLHTSVATLDSALALMTDVALRPTFPEKSFAQQKSARLTALLQEADRAPAMADRAFAALVFGDNNPYGGSPGGTREDVETITREDVDSFWKTWYRPNNATLVMVGDLSVAEAMRRATAAFGAWQRADLPALAKVVPSSAGATTVYVVDKAKAPQSSFRIGGVGVARNTKDYYPLMVMNTALGGSFTSRLNQNLRETKGYTYGANSGFTMRREPGSFTARAEVVAAKTDSSLIEFMKELSSIREPLPAAELAKVKKYLQLGYAERFESTTDIAGQIAALIPSGIPLATLGSFNAGVGAVTAAEVQRVANQYVDPKKMVIVVAGDRASIEGALKATKIAPVIVVDARGRRLPVP